MRREDEAGGVMRGLHCLSVVNDRAPVCACVDKGGLIGVMA